MSSNGIQIDFGQAMAQAARLDKIASEIERIAQREIEGNAESLKNGWKGEAASMYIDKGKLLSDKAQKTAKDLRNAADKLRWTARKLKMAEEAALAILRRKG